MSDAWRTQIDKLLAEMRPDRYVKDGGDEWLDEVSDAVASLIPDAEAREIAASQAVRRREGALTKSTNRLLREIYEAGQPPLDWLETLHLPLATGKERVALRAVTENDFLVFARDERRAAANDFASRNETCQAAEWLAVQMKSQGATYFREMEWSETA